MNLETLELQLSIMQSQQKVMASAIESLGQLIAEARAREKLPRRAGDLTWGDTPPTMQLQDVARITGRNLSTVRRWLKKP